MDTTADMLTIIRNGQAAGLASVWVPFSKMKQAVADILVAEGFLAAVELKDGRNAMKKLKLTLKYDGQGMPIIQSLKKVSKPGRRVYKGYQELPIVLNKLGIAIVSTPQGLMTAKAAKQKKVGGEVIAEVY